MLALSILTLLLLGLTGCGRSNPPRLFEQAVGETFDVYRDGTSSTYHADAPSQTYTGSLKSVVQQAAAYLVAGSGGTISFGAGDFDLGSDWFELYDVTGIIFEGQGIDVTVIRNSSSASTDTEPFDCTRCDGITIRDMTVSAGGPDRSTSDALDFDGSDGVTIERVKITDSRARGIVFDGKGDPGENLDTADGNTIRDCEIIGSAIPSDGITLLASNQNLVEGCRVQDVGGTGIYANKASSGADQPNKPSNDNVIRDNHVENVGRDGIKVNSGSRNLITNNTVLNSSDDVSSLDGIRIISFSSVPCDDNQVTLNTATDTQSPKTQKYGLKIVSSACNRTVVDGNNFAGNLVGAIFDNGTDTIYNSSDNQPPTTPTNLSASASGTQVALSWNAATDNVAVTGYEVWRNGTALVMVGTATTYTDVTVQPNTTYDYQVRAKDAAGNWSGLSSVASVDTSGGGNMTTFVAVDDAYVRENSPASNYGTSTTLRVDGDAKQDTLVKFLVTGVGNGAVSSAKLRLYNTNSASLGGNFFTAGSAWDESSVTWNSAPATGSSIGSLGTVKPGNWYEVDVTSAVTQDGWVSFRITSNQANGAYYSSKEGPNAPQLVVTATGNTSGNSPPTAYTQSVSTGQGEPVTVTLSGFDGDGDCPLSFSVTDQPNHGNLSSLGNQQCGGGSGSARVTYTPDAGYSGSDSFDFRLSDPDGATSSPATVSVTVVAGANTLTFTPTHDSYVRENAAHTNYGSATSLKADGSPVQDMLLTFDVTGAGAVTGAVLRLYNVNSASLGGNFSKMGSGWNENSVTWSNAPGRGAPLGSLGTVKPGNWYEVDVTSAVTGNGRFSFRVSSDQANGAYYSSKEGENAPELIVTTE